MLSLVVRSDAFYFNISNAKKLQNYGMMIASNCVMRISSAQGIRLLLYHLKMQNIFNLALALRIYDFLITFNLQLGKLFYMWLKGPRYTLLPPHLE